MDNGRRAERGQGLVEYSFVIFLVAFLVIALLVFFGHDLAAIFGKITAGL